MARTKGTAPAEHPTTPGYVLRGLGIAELHGDEILASYQGGGRYLVPSGSEANGLYEVRVGTRPERNTCECRGFASHKHCSHVVAAQRTAKRSAVCDGCGVRTWHRDLVEVTEDHESLTWFVGDLLCRRCARGEL
ncbi:MAG: hypothetical protein M3Q60_15600 [Actinomycetota bacterium]|jgi:hypothetical protein|nr:hypothetical protein [Actinomycetota bacterium]